MSMEAAEGAVIVHAGVQMRMRGNEAQVDVPVSPPVHLQSAFCPDS